MQRTSSSHVNQSSYGNHQRNKPVTLTSNSVLSSSPTRIPTLSRGKTPQQLQQNLYRDSFLDQMTSSNTHMNKFGASVPGGGGGGGGGMNGQRNSQYGLGSLSGTGSEKTLYISSNNSNDDYSPYASRSSLKGRNSSGYYAANSGYDGEQYSPSSSFLPRNSHRTQQHQHQPTNVFVEVELPRELMVAATAAKNGGNSRASQGPYVPLPGYNNSDRDRSYNSLLQTTDATANSLQFKSPSKPGLFSTMMGRRGSDVEQILELERLNQRVGYRDIDGEGRPVVDRRKSLFYAGMFGGGKAVDGIARSNLLGDFLMKGGTESRRESAVVRGLEGLEVRERSYNHESITGSGTPRHQDKVLDRSGSQNIEYMLRNSKTERNDTRNEYNPASNSPKSAIRKEGSDPVISTQFRKLPTAKGREIPQNQASLNDSQTGSLRNLSNVKEQTKYQKYEPPEKEEETFLASDKDEESNEDDGNESEASYGSEHSIKIHANLGKSQHPDEYGPKQKLLPCRVCGRKFASDRVSKHEKACKSSSKPRKTFDGTKMRTKGLEKVRDEAAERKLEEMRKAKKDVWKQKHEELIESLRAAKQLQAHLDKGGKASDLPPPRVSQTVPTGQECPHCLRRFNENSYSRHVEVCLRLKQKGRPTKVNPFSRK
ncbi:hypothetical protein BDR26DRAFT_853957 [Obelidium mucronatum]|nr:hypothetical protein BDR26DRAFT_853957 [Obelidium mucronatum]